MHTFQPTVRLVAVVAEIGPPREGEEGDFRICTYVCPVLAVEATKSDDDESVQYAGVIVFRGELVSTSNLSDGTEVQIVACLWSPEDDENRLKDTVQELKDSAQATAAILVKNDDLPYSMPTIPRAKK